MRTESDPVRLESLPTERQLLRFVIPAADNALPVINELRVDRDSPKNTWSLTDGVDKIPSAPRPAVDRLLPRRANALTDKLLPKLTAPRAEIEELVVSPAVIDTPELR